MACQKKKKFLKKKHPWLTTLYTLYTTTTGSEDLFFFQGHHDFGRKVRKSEMDLKRKPFLHHKPETT